MPRLKLNTFTITAKFLFRTLTSRGCKAVSKFSSSFDLHSPCLQFRARKVSPVLFNRRHRRAPVSTMPDTARDRSNGGKIVIAAECEDREQGEEMNINKLKGSRKIKGTKTAIHGPVHRRSEERGKKLIGYAGYSGGVGRKY